MKEFEEQFLSRGCARLELENTANAVPVTHILLIKAAHTERVAITE